MTTSSTAITVMLLAASHEFVDSSHGCTRAPSTYYPGLQMGYAA